MPYYDRLCNRCGWLAVDALEACYADAPACPDCGTLTVRTWLTKPPTAIGDAMDHVQVNGLKEPRRFTSKQERRRWMKENGFREFVRHIDGSPHTERWATMDALTLANATALVTRAAKEPARNDPADHPLHVQHEYGDVKIGPAGAVELIPYGQR